MNRERWQPFPVSTPDERRLFDRLPASDEAFVTAASPRGERTLRVRRTLEIEEPFAGAETGQAVCRLVFVDGPPADDETLSEDPWLLASAFLAQRAADVRAELEEAGR